MIPTLPTQATDVLDALRRAGGAGWLVGGALRDLMMGREPGDWDFASTLSPEEILAAFPRGRLIGGACGTVRAPFGEGSCEITPCRAETGYTDKRHPDEVRFVPDILADLSRRDFTVNAMAFDGAVLLDPFGGQQDLKRKLLRCVGNPTDRFEEDALRILRLFRFAAQLGFTAEWNTFAAAAAATGGIAALPRERVSAEVRTMLLSDAPQVIGGLIANGGLKSYGFEFAPSLGALAEVPRLLLCRWWALMALCGAPPETVAQDFGFSRRFADKLAECTRLYRRGPARDTVQLKGKLRDGRLDYAPIAATFAAVSPAYAAEPALFALVCAKNEPYRLRDLAVNGDMLRYEGIKGADCGQILDQLLSAVIKNPALNQTPVLLGLARGLKELL